MEVRKHGAARLRFVGWSVRSPLSEDFGYG